MSGVYGVKGWLRVFSHTQPRERILSYRPWLIQRGGSWQVVEVEAGQAHAKGVLVKLAGCDDRDAAARLIGADIAIRREQLEALAPGEYYWADLIGLRVETVAGVALGRVETLLETGANDVLVVQDGRRERLIPYVRPQFVTEIDLARGLLVVDWDPEF